MNSITIGILGGMGPRSTSPFLEMLLDECQKQYGAKYDIDYPQIVIYSLPTPFYLDKENNQEDLKNSIKDGLKRLNSFEVDIIGIPCNSAHLYFNYITNGIDTPVLNIIDETLNYIEPNSRVALFATELTIKSRLYQNGLEQKNCKYVVKAEWQQTVNSIIKNIKNKEPIIEINKLWNDLITEVNNAKVDTIIIGCTDLSNLPYKGLKNTLIVDSSKKLASSIISRYVN